MACKKPRLVTSVIRSFLISYLWFWLRSTEAGCTHIRSYLSKTRYRFSVAISAELHRLQTWRLLRLRSIYICTKLGIVLCSKQGDFTHFLPSHRISYCGAYIYRLHVTQICRGS